MSEGKFWKKHRRLKWSMMGIGLIAVVILGTYARLMWMTPSEGQKRKELSKKSKGIQCVNVNYSLSGMGGHVKIDEVEDQNMQATPGMQGIPVEINVKRRKVKKANIEFVYDPKQIDEKKAENLKIAYYNEKLGRMELLEDSKVNLKKNTISVNTTHFSTYSVVDSEEWYEAWAQSQIMIRDEQQAQNDFELVFVIDHSSSMDSNDKNGLSKTCTYDFIKELYDGDFFSIVKFNEEAETVLPEIQVEDVHDWDSLENTINGIMAMGGTDIGSGIAAGLEIFGLQDEPTNPLMILLSDGQSDLDDTILEKCAEAGIRIITIGLGEDVDISLMKHIAYMTEGKYFKVEKSGDMSEVFNQIREEYVGIDLSQDRDNDGIPDKVETTGMRNQYGKIIKTNYKKPDTDGDGISDGTEMGEVIVDEHVSELDRLMGIQQNVYFSMVSDPTIYDVDKTYNPKINLETEAKVDKNGTVNLSVKVFNGAQIVATDKNCKNKINDLKSVKLKLDMPSCFETKNSEKNLGNISGSDSAAFSTVVHHKVEKCCGERHVITITVTADGLKEKKFEVRVKDINWFEQLSEEEYDSADMALIRKVKEYTSQYDEDKMKAVLEDESMTAEEKKEYISEISQSTQNRHKMEYLVNNDIYVAHSFRKYVEENCFVGGTIDLSKFVFSDGIFSTIYSVGEKERYKNMLLEYIKEQEEIQREEYVLEKLMSVMGGTIEEYSKAVEELSKQYMVLNEQCLYALDGLKNSIQTLKHWEILTVDQIQREFDSILEEIEILKKNNVKIKKIDPIKLELPKEFQKDVDASGEISKESKVIGITMTVGSEAVHACRRILEIESVAFAYQHYEDFLSDISENSAYPEFSAAAKELSGEMKNQKQIYWDQAGSFIFNVCDNFASDLLEEEAVKELLEAIAGNSDSLSSVGLGAFIGKLIANYGLGVDDMLEKTVFVIGTSETADRSAKKLIRAAVNFQQKYYLSKEEALQAAKAYQTCYEELWNMRIFGEQAYLDMKGMNGAEEHMRKILRKWVNYEYAEQFCNETLYLLEEIKF